MDVRRTFGGSVFGSVILAHRVFHRLVEDKPLFRTVDLQNEDFVGIEVVFKPLRPRPGTVKVEMGGILPDFLLQRPNPVCEGGNAIVYVVDD